MARYLVETEGLSQDGFDIVHGGIAANDAVPVIQQGLPVMLIDVDSVVLGAPACAAAVA